MRVNVGLPGPFSVSGNAPKGCGPWLLLAGVVLVLYCCGGAIINSFLERF